MQPIDYIYPNVKNPYYIVAPPYTRTSAGVRVLHLLCHSLNRRGQTAYLLFYPALPWRKRLVAPDLLTPILTPFVVQSHFERGLSPIMVYPETVSGNPFNSPCVVRYVMNFPGLLGGDKEYDANELCYSYSQVLAKETHFPDNILFLPPTDTHIFYPEPEKNKRQGTCFYADKYKIAHKGKLFEITKDSTEITRNLPTSQSPQEIAALFRRSELFFTYENTALATEAVLCGCPTVFLPNPHLTEIIAIKELGADGMAWGAEPAEIERAKATVQRGAENYLGSYAEYWRALDRFILLTQEYAKDKNYPKPVYLPGFFYTVFCVIQDRTFWGFVKAAARKMIKVARGIF